MVKNGQKEKTGMRGGEKEQAGQIQKLVLTSNPFSITEVVQTMNNNGCKNATYKQGKKNAVMLLQKGNNNVS